MKRFGLLLSFLLCIRCAFAQVPEAGSYFDFSSVSLNQVVTLYFKEVSKGPYVVCNDVLADTRPVSIRASGKGLDRAVVELLLASFGYEARVEDGMTVVCRRPSAPAIEESVFVYRPLHRDPGYLVEFLSSIVKGSFANKRGGGPSFSVGGASMSPPSPQAGGGSPVPSGPGQHSPSPMASYRSNTGDDYLVYSGSESDVTKLQKLLAQIDVPTGEVVVKGYIYEVGKNDSDASAFDVLVSVLGKRLSLSLDGAVLGNALRLKTASLDVVASMLRSDGRFRVVTSPFTRVRSGGTARFVVGSDVPVLGAIVTAQNGATQQSVEYRSSGTIFEVSPKVRDKTTDLDLFQQISSFVSTDTGVNGSPTLNKRELRTSLSVEDGEIVVIGGLNDLKDESANSGLSFLPFALSRSRASRSSELLLVLELKRI